MKSRKDVEASKEENSDLYGKLLEVVAKRQFGNFTNTVDVMFHKDLTVENNELGSLLRTKKSLGMA